jgi:hypothetical protein
MPASVFQPSLYADVYLDGVSLPASTTHCKTRRSLVPSGNVDKYGAYGMSDFFRVAVLHPSFSKTVSRTVTDVVNMEETTLIEAKLTADGQPTIQLTSPLDQFIRHVGLLKPS